MFTYFLMIVAALLYIALAYFLVRRYIHSRNKGFIWLGGAFFLWPFIQNVLGVYQLHLLNGMMTRQYPSWLSTNGITPGVFMEDFRLAELTVLPALLLIAVYYLGNRKIETREALT
jgi:hypothetical protein